MPPSALTVVTSDNTPCPGVVMDQDTQAVAERLDAAVASSGLSMRQFAHALGTSPSCFSSYTSGRVAPSAAFLIRAERIALALEKARRDGVPSVIDAFNSIRRAASKGDDDWTYALSSEARDRLHEILRRRRSLAPCLGGSTALDGRGSMDRARRGAGQPRVRRGWAADSQVGGRVEARRRVGSRHASAQCS